jgi:hypothetical protein
MDQPAIKGGNMPKYLCLQRSQPSPGTGELPSPMTMEEMYAKFNTWKERFRENIVDMGGRLGAGKMVTTEGIADGPFIELKEVIGGYMIVSAQSLAEAVDVARACPGLVSAGSGVEVREIYAP